MENKRKEVVRGNENAYIADNTELAYSIHVVVKASSQNFNRKEGRQIVYLLRS